MGAIFFVLCTRCQWGARDATGTCNHSPAQGRFRQWVEVGVYVQFWIYGLLAYDELQGIDWNWVTMDGAMAKAPLGSKKPVQPPPTGPNAVPNAVCSPQR
jgi:hypothetical protein